MSLAYKDRLAVTVSAVASAGLGAFTVGAAVASLGDGAAATAFVAGDDGKAFDTKITEGGTWETRTGCVYTHSGTSLARGTLYDSSTAGPTAVAFTADAIVVATPGAAQFTLIENALLLGAEIAVTAATTATAGRMHLCTGTSADYTVTLPAAASCSGQHIGFRMGTESSLTKLITLDGNSTETIDGSLTRVMWSFEVAVLKSDGSNWFKVGGRSIPMQCTMYLSSGQSTFTNGAVVQVTVDAADNDNTGRMANTGSNRIDILRTSIYAMFGKAQRDIAVNSLAVVRWISLLYVSGAQASSAETSCAALGYPTPFVGRTQAFTAGQYVDLRVYQDSGVTQGCVGSSGKETQVGVTEVLQW